MDPISFLITYQAHLRCGHETQSSSRARRRPRIDGQAAGNVVSGPPEPQFPAASSRKVSLVRNQDQLCCLRLEQWRLEPNRRRIRIEGLDRGPRQVLSEGLAQCDAAPHRRTHAPHRPGKHCEELFLGPELPGIDPDGNRAVVHRERFLPMAPWSATAFPVRPALRTPIRSQTAPLIRPPRHAARKPSEKRARVTIRLTGPPRTAREP